MYKATFANCSGLTGKIPDELFGKLSGAVQDMAFYETFANCSGLTGGIPENLFGNIRGFTGAHWFYCTFFYCTGLTGESAKQDGKFLYEIWPNAAAGAMYRGCTGLTDYADIPSNWK